ncbi:MAG: F0F1 ATP synthase subunit delta [Pseudomonadota bacterium]
MSEAITTARPYAQAAFEEAQKLNVLQAWSDALNTLADAVAHPEVRAVIGNPKVPKEQLASLMEGLLGGKADAKLKNFVRILADNQRIDVLPEIATSFAMLKAEAEKSVNVVVESPFELSADQHNKIVAALKKRMGRDVKLESRIKKELLGGVVIRAGDKVIDGSALTRLGEMATALA